MQKYILILCLACTYITSAQDINTNLSWQKKAKLAKEMVQKNDYNKAGQYYHSAWADQPKKLDFAYKAGENFFKARNYKMAAKAYEPIKSNSKFDEVGYKYALSMKRSGEYGAALIAFEDCSADKLSTAMKTEIAQHIEGCQLGQQLKLKADNTIQATHAGYTLNSEDAEFAPFPASDNHLYFTSFSEGTAKIYTADPTNSGWTSPKSLNVRSTEKDHYGNCTFTPDMQKMYFTQCDVDKDGTSKCHIYALEKDGGMWKDPIKLSKTINDAGVNATHPAVFVSGEQEYLYFASDRVGGHGGMDIWYSVKNIGESPDKFSQPVNLGKTINTAQDDITPFQAPDGTFYFSSNGHPNIGGFDVFKTQKNGNNWATPQNMGLPVNSSTDDMYYVQSSDASTAYVVSKRSQEGIKATVADDDIFVIKNPVKDVFVKGTISVEGIALQDVELSLYKKNTLGKMRKILGEKATGGQYSLQLEANQTYRLHANKKGYEESVFEFTTDNDETEITYNFNLLTEESTALTAGGNETAETKKIVQEISDNKKLDLDVVPSKRMATRGKMVKRTPAADTIIKPKAPVVESVPRTKDNEAQATTPVKTPAPSRTVQSQPVPAQPSADYGVYSEPIKTKEGYWVIGISPTFTEPTQAQGSYSLGHGNTTPTASDTYRPTTTTTYTPPPATTYTPIPSYTPTPSYTNSTNTSGKVYRIQISARKSYKASRYDKVSDLGSIVLEDTETDKGKFVRIMIDGFYTLEDAKRTLAQAKQRGFEGAFITIYNNGVRAKRIIR